MPPAPVGAVGTVYLLHLEPGLPVTGGRVARHYVGWTAGPVQARLREHLAGAGSPLIRAAVAAGCEVTVERAWPGTDRHFERQLKRRHETPRLCPRCVHGGRTGGRGLLLDPIRALGGPAFAAPGPRDPADYHTPSRGGTMNQLTLSGRLTRDPELGHTKDGEPICRIRIAVDGMGQGRDEPGFIDVTEFGASGEASARVLSKGWLVGVQGRLQHRHWETDGERRQAYAVIGRIEFLAAPRNTDAGREAEAVLEQAHEEVAAVDGSMPGSADRIGSALGAAAEFGALADPPGADW